MKNIFLESSKKIIDANTLINKDDIIKALTYSGNDQKHLWKIASTFRNERYGNKLFVRGSLELSNICSNTCAFCGMSKNNTLLTRYTLTYDDAKDAIDKAKAYGVKQLHLVSGEYNNLDWDLLKAITLYAKKEGLSVTLVLGEIDENNADMLFKAGATRYICKFETSNAILYSKYKGNKNLYDRIAFLLMVREMGYQIGTGVILGLPETTMEDMCNDLALLQRINPDMASVSLFRANECSELAGMNDGNYELCLNFIALMRLILVNTPIITCSSSMGAFKQVDALNAGANVMSLHITPEQVAEKFSMYTSKNRTMSQYEHIVNCSKVAKMEIAAYE